MMGRSSQATGDQGSAAPQTPRQRALALMAQKDELEKQLKEQQDILRSNNKERHKFYD